MDEKKFMNQSVMSIKATCDLKGAEGRMECN